MKHLTWHRSWSLNNALLKPRMQKYDTKRTRIIVRSNLASNPQPAKAGTPKWAWISISPVCSWVCIGTVPVDMSMFDCQAGVCRSSDVTRSVDRGEWWRRPNGRLTSAYPSIHITCSEWTQSGNVSYVLILGCWRGTPEIGFTHYTHGGIDVTSERSDFVWRIRIFQLQCTFCDRLFFLKQSEA